MLTLGHTGQKCQRWIEQNEMGLKFIWPTNIYYCSMLGLGDIQVKRCGFSHLRVPDLVLDKVNELYYELLCVIKAMISLKWVL